jgi:F420-non-reducing hydrogenase small subunit
MSKIKLAVYLSAGCAGCEMALVDLSEKLIDALENIEIVWWAPTVVDLKYKDLENLEDKSIDVALVDGAVRLSEQDHVIKILRQKTKVLVAFGACAAMGGIPGLANFHKREELLETAYINTWSTDNPDGVLPQTEYDVNGSKLTLPEFYGEVKALHQVVDVDYFIGGCPPHHNHVAVAVEAIIKGELPPKGSWITSGKSVCDSCRRNPVQKGEIRKPIEEVRRTIEGTPDEECLLQQGYLCLGPVTQGDCDGSCPQVNIPCRGCGGPVAGKDFGARAVGALASLMTDEAVDEMLEKIPNLGKFLYRYSLPVSLINRKK